MKARVVAGTELASTILHQHGPSTPSDLSQEAVPGRLIVYITLT